MSFKIFHGDCLETLQNAPDNSMDSIVTDPPYGLSFMSKKWDYDVPSTEIWKECLRVLKPGGHLLAFGGTRTYHRLVVAIEDAGFEIRDQIQWIYGQGFPKSQNLAKAAGDESLAGLGTTLKPANEPICLARKPLSESTIAKNVLKHGTGGLNIDGTRISTEGQDMGDPNRFKKAGAAAYLPISKLRQLKAEGHTSWGHVGNIDAAIARAEKHQEASSDSMAKTAELGRFPSNVILDEDAAQVLDEQSGVLAKGRFPGKQSQHDASSFSVAKGNIAPERDLDSGGASRFFYVAKASKSDRGADNTHPTVKPIKLMEYLIKLVTPEGGIVLDPFMGSGTTGVAALRNGFRFRGIEREENYFYISQARLEKEDQ